MATKYGMSCDCGFSVNSHRKGEVVEMGRVHVKKEHGQTVSEAQMAKNVKARRS